MHHSRADWILPICLFSFVCYSFSLTLSYFSDSYDYTSSWDEGYTDELVVSNRSTFICHGTLMLFVWLYCVPTGIMLIRQEKAHHLSVTAHKTLVTVGIVSTLTLFMQMLATAAGTTFTTHGKWACAVVAFILVQVPTGFLINWHLRKDKFRDQGVMLKYVHKVVGPLLWVFALLACRRGIHLLTGGTDWHIPTHLLMDITVLLWLLGFTYICAVGLHKMRMAAMETQGRSFSNWTFFKDYAEGKPANLSLEYYRNSSKKEEEDESSKSMPVFTMTDVADMISRGNHVIILDGMVVDVRRFIKSHPGGRQVLLNRVGLDCTSQFKNYAHSLKAWKIANEMCIGMMQIEENFGTFYNELTFKSKELVCKDGEDTTYAFTFIVNHADFLEEFGHVFVFHAFCPEFDTVVERKYYPYRLKKTILDVLQAEFLIKVYENGVMGTWLAKMTSGDKIRAYVTMDSGLFRNPALEMNWTEVILFAEENSIVSALRTIEFLKDENRNLSLRLFHYLRVACEHPQELLEEYKFSKITVSLKCRERDWEGAVGYSLPTLLDFLDVDYELFNKNESQVDEAKRGEYGLEVQIEFDHLPLESGAVWIPPKAHQRLQQLGLVMICGRSSFCTFIRKSLHKIGIPESKIVMAVW